MNSAENKIKVLLTDDHHLVIDGIRLSLQNETDISIEGEANSGKEALQALNNIKADVVVLDISMPGLDGFDTVKEIQKHHPDTKILILSFHKDESVIEKILGENVAGYINKERKGTELVKAIREVAAGNTYYDRDVQTIITRIIRQRRTGADKAASLSEREIEVLKYLAENMSSKEIGQKLFISPSTVETYKRNAAEKLGLKGTGELKRYLWLNSRNRGAH